MCDDDYREETFRPVQGCRECECGADLTPSSPPELCTCGKTRCPDCTHRCEWCGDEGCEACMENTEDGWAHTDECAAELDACEGRRDAEWPATSAKLRSRK